MLVVEDTSICYMNKGCFISMEHQLQVLEEGPHTVILVNLS